MRLRNTLLLAALFILLAAYIYFFELQKEGRGKSARLLNFKAEEAAAIVLSYPRQEIQLQREPPGKWQLTQPLRADADESTIGSMLAALSAGEILRTLEEKPSAEDLKSFGLDRPAVKVSITLKSGVTLPQLLLGARTPFGDAAYVQRGSEPSVYLTDGSLPLALQRELNDFRHKPIVAEEKTGSKK